MNRVPPWQRRASLALVLLASTGCDPAEAPSAPPTTTQASAPAEPIGTAREAAQAPPTCVTLLRGGAGNGFDTMLNQEAGATTTNYGATTLLGAGSAQGTLRYALLKWDLSPIPAGATLVSATVSLSLGSTGAGTPRVHLVTAPWTENTVTWASFGNGFNAAVLTSFSNGYPSSPTVTFDVLATAKGWMSGAIPNQGLLLEQQEPTLTRVKSAEYSVTSQRPSLKVCYQPSACAAGTADCDGNAANGCETSLTTTNNCGACGVSCEDNNPCTVDGCVAGACVHPAAAGGTACNDGNACTLSDSCQAGACVGASPKTCVASDQCHVAGTCDPATGACSNPTAAEGTSCNDGNACTLSDSCQAGSCVGASPVVCAATDACHAAGACDPATGACSNPTAPCCSDGVQNQGETGVDCGGPCPACATSMLLAAQGTGGTPGDLFLIDLSAGTISTVGPLGVGLTGLAASPAGVIYGVTSSGRTHADIVVVDPSTAAVAMVGSLDDAAASDHNHWTSPDLTFVGDTLVGWSNRDFRLLWIETSTGLGHAVGNANRWPTGGALAASADGKLFLADNTSLDAVTPQGALQFVAPLDISDSRILAMTFVGTTLYGVRGAWGGAEQLVTIDTTTGETTTVMSLPSGIDALTSVGYSGPPLSDCADGVQNGLEAGVDCGGPCFAPCPPPSCVVDDVLASALATGDTTQGQDRYSGSCGGNGAPEHTFAWTAPAAGTYRFDTYGSAFDTVLYAHDGDCNGAELGCNDDAGSPQSKLVLDLTAGQTIFIAVDGFNGNAQGSFTLNIGPDCDVIATIPSSSPSWSSSNAFWGNHRAGSCGGADGPESFWQWTAPAKGLWRFSTTSSAPGTDTILYALDGTCGGPELGCNDNAPGSLASTLELQLDAGQTIVLAVDSPSPAAAGSFTLTLQNLTPSCGACPGACPCAPPALLIAQESGGAAGPLLHFDPTTQALSPLPAPAAPLAALATAPDGTIVGVVPGSSGPAELFDLDPATGVTLDLGPLHEGASGLGIPAVPDLTFAGGRLIGWIDAQDRLGRIDTADAAVTPFGLGVDSIGAAIAADQNGNVLVAPDGLNGALYRLDGNGNATFLGTMNGALGDVRSMTFANGMLYAVASDGISTTELVSIDPLNAEVTLLAALPLGAMAVTTAAYHGPTAPTCADGVQNQLEAGVDCGGPCAAACPPAVCPFQIAIPSGNGTYQAGTFLGNHAAGSCGGATGPEFLSQWTAPEGGHWRLHTTPLAVGVDTVLYVRDGDCNGQELACNDDAPGGGPGSSVDLHLAAGQQVWIGVDARTGSTGGSYILWFDNLSTYCSKGSTPNGAACDDGNACTLDDVCQGGACVAGGNVACAPIDACHVAGTCDPATGACSSPTAADGTSCNDGNACTHADGCQAGACTGTGPVALGSATGVGVASGTTLGAADNASPGCVNGSGGDVAYTYTAAATGTHVFEVHSQSPAQHLVYLRAGCGGAELACNGKSFVSAALTAGQQIALFVDTKAGKIPGAFTLDITAPPTCQDGVQNQAEDGVDCGGPCPACGAGTCADGVQNQTETGVDCGGPCASCASPYLLAAAGAHGAAGQLYQIDPQTAAATSIGNVGFALTGLATAPSGAVYGVTSQQPSYDGSTLVTVDPQTGAGASIAPLRNITDGHTLLTPDITFAGEVLFGAARKTYGIVTIDRHTGFTTSLPSAPPDGFGLGLAADASGALYLAPGGPSGPLVRIDPATGQHQTVATLDGPGETISAMTSWNGTLYAVVSDWDGAFWLATIDKTTGHMTTVGPLPAGIDALDQGLLGHAGAGYRRDEERRRDRRRLHGESCGPCPALHLPRDEPRERDGAREPRRRDGAERGRARELRRRRGAAGLVLVDGAGDGLILLLHRGDGLRHGALPARRLRRAELADDDDGSAPTSRALVSVVAGQTSSASSTATPTRACPRASGRRRRTGPSRSPSPRARATRRSARRSTPATCRACATRGRSSAGRARSGPRAPRATTATRAPRSTPARGHVRRLRGRRHLRGRRADAPAPTARRATPARSPATTTATATPRTRPAPAPTARAGPRAPYLATAGLIGGTVFYDDNLDGQQMPPDANSNGGEGARHQRHRLARDRSGLRRDGGHVDRHGLVRRPRQQVPALGARRGLLRGERRGPGELRRDGAAAERRRGEPRAGDAGGGRHRPLARRRGRATSTTPDEGAARRAHGHPAGGTGWQADRRLDTDPGHPGQRGSARLRQGPRRSRRADGRMPGPGDGLLRHQRRAHRRVRAAHPSLRHRRRRRRLLPAGMRRAVQRGPRRGRHGGRRPRRLLLPQDMPDRSLSAQLSSARITP
ncbi:MAG: DNRLRE domain-containing protein [Byssovorax sp.]